MSEVHQCNCKYCDRRERKKRGRPIGSKNLPKTVTCECGVTYSRNNKTHHERTKQHLEKTNTA